MRRNDVNSEVLNLTSYECSTTLIVAGTMSFAGNLSEPVETVSVVPTTAAAPVGNWTGYYVGGELSVGDITDGFVDIDYDSFGIHAGYLRDLGSFVVDGEFGLEAGNISDDLGTDIDADVARLKAIAGYDLGSFMPYFAVGVVAIDLETNFSDTVGFYGLGASYAINDKFRVGAEYLVHDTDDFDGGGELELDTLSLRASYTF